MRAYWLLLQGIRTAVRVTNPNYWKLYCGCPKAPSTPPAYYLLNLYLYYTTHLMICQVFIIM